jgi:cation diffusion facilitator family transporter
LTVDGIDILVNVSVAALTGSTVMLVEAFSGVADFASMLLLFIGHGRAGRHATPEHPFGFGKEQYFWATLAGFIILVITANISFIFGWHAFRHPEPVSHLGLTYAVLGFSFVTTGFAFLQAGHTLLAGRPWRQLWPAFQHSWQIELKTTVVLDLMGTVAAVVGLTALVAYGLTGRHSLDGLGAMMVAVVLAVFALVLLGGVRSLIIGQSVALDMQTAIKQAMLSVPEVLEVVRLQTMVLGSETFLVNADVNLKNGLQTDEVERTLDLAKQAVQRDFPGKTLHAFFEPVANKLT